jgi:hypothetical protein
MKKIIFSISSAILIFIADSNFCLAQQMSAAQFLVQYKEEQSFLHKNFSKVSFSYNRHYGKTVMRVTGYSDFDKHVLETNTSESIIGRNSKYTFTLQNNPVTHEYKMLTCEANDVSLPATSLHFIQSPWCDLELQQPLYDMFTGRQYYISDVNTNCNWLGESCYCISIKRINNDGNQDSSPSKIQFYLDHKRHFVCIGQRLTLDDGFYYTNVSYSADSIPKLQTYEVGRLSSAGKKAPRFTIEILNSTSLDANFDYQRFQLSYYGLPEPEGVVWEKPTPSYVWYLSIAGGAAAIMFLCGWLLKRRAKARAAAVPATSPLPPPRVE